MLRLLVIAIGFIPTAARADGVTNEISTGTTSGNTWIANRTVGEWEIDRALVLNVAYGATRGSTWSHAVSVAASYELDEHLSVTGVARWAPAATAASQLTLPGADGEDGGIAELVVKSSSGALAATLGYQSTGDGEGETSASITMAIDHVAARQALTSIDGRDGAMVTLDDLRARCELQTCHPGIDAALSGDLRRLSQLSVSASVVRTEDRDVDLGLDATYYFHAGPLAGSSRVAEGAVASLPLHYALSPSFAHRWRTVQATLGGTYASYLESQGEEIGGFAKVQYKPTRSVRLYSTLAGTWVIDAFQQLSTSFSFAVGGKYTW